MFQLLVMVGSFIAWPVLYVWEDCGSGWIFEIVGLEEVEVFLLLARLPISEYTVQFTYWYREGGRVEIEPKRRLEGQQFTKLGRKFQHDWLYLQSINSDKHLPQSPFTGQFFRWRHFALVSIEIQLVHDWTPQLHVKVSLVGVILARRQMSKFERTFLCRLPHDLPPGYRHDSGRLQSCRHCQRLRQG